MILAFIGLFGVLSMLHTLLLAALYQCRAIRDAD